MNFFRGPEVSQVTVLYTTNVLLGNLPDVITDPVIETARNRAHMLRETRELFVFI